jgi:hypothetical protein
VSALPRQWRPTTPRNETLRVPLCFSSGATKQETACLYHGLTANIHARHVVEMEFERVSSVKLQCHHGLEPDWVSSVLGTR